MLLRDTRPAGGGRPARRRGQWMRSCAFTACGRVGCGGEGWEVKARAKPVEVRQVTYDVPTGLRVVLDQSGQGQDVVTYDVLGMVGGVVHGELEAPGQLLVAQSSDDLDRLDRPGSGTVDVERQCPAGPLGGAHGDAGREGRNWRPTSTLSVSERS